MSRTGATGTPDPKKQSGECHLHHSSELGSLAEDERSPACRRTSSVRRWSGCRSGRHGTTEASHGTLAEQSRTGGEVSWKELRNGQIGDYFL